MFLPYLFTNAIMLLPTGMIALQTVISLFEKHFWLRFTLCILAGVIMLAFVLISGSSISHATVELAVIGAILLIFFTLPIITEKGVPFPYMAVGAVVAAALVYLRLCMFFYASSDYTNFLAVWVEEMRTLSLADAMSKDIGDYNMPYLYILFIISRLKLPSLLLIKFVSCVFDGLAAFFVMKIVGHFKDSAAAKITAFLLALALPTVWLNSAYWGQCDVVFTSLCIGMAYGVLKGKGNLAAVFWALAFSFKLQAIFALPFLIIGLFIKRIKAHSLLLVPPVFFATLLPAFVCGRSFTDCVKIYFLQANQYPKMTLNLPSIWALVGDVSFDHFGTAAVFLAGAATLVFLFLCYHYRNSIDDQKLITLFFLGALLLPYLLPRMHDRYFFLADVAALLVFLIDLKKWYLPIITVFSSYVCYHYFVMGGHYLIELKYLSVALLVLLTVSIRDVFWQKKAK